MAVSSKIVARADLTYRFVKIIAVWGIAALIGYLLFPVISTYLSRLEILAIIVAVNAIATITLWREAARSPPRPNKKFLKNLLYAAPIEPDHERPKVIGDEYPSLASDDDRRFFVDFAEFVDVVNCWLAEKYVGSRWRLQELPTTELRLNHFSSGPEFGRRYALFHNQIKLGELEISPSISYSTETPEVHTNIEISWARLLSMDDITNFLDCIAMHVTNPRQDSAEYAAARRTIHFALTKCLWGTYRVSEFKGFEAQDWGELELSLDGSAEWYLERAPGWRRTVSENNVKITTQQFAPRSGQRS
jgi:hypothetical protein